MFTNLAILGAPPCISFMGQIWWFLPSRREVAGGHLHDGWLLQAPADGTAMALFPWHFWGGRRGDAGGVDKTGGCWHWFSMIFHDFLMIFHDFPMIFHDFPWFSMIFPCFSHVFPMFFLIIFAPSVFQSKHLGARNRRWWTSPIFFCK